MKFQLSFVSILISSFLFAQDKNVWNVEAHGGFPINIPLPLTIKQSNYADINFTAQFYSEPFTPPVFWVYRISKWKNDKAWELEMIHQKLYLKNTAPEIDYFSITHGYNMLMVNRGFKFNLFNEQKFIARFGAGLVIPHAENKIRGKELPQGDSYFSGYTIGGPVINIALAKQFKLSNRFYLNTEIKNNTSYAVVPIVDGRAYVWHSAIEFIGGIGFSITTF